MLNLAIKIRNLWLAVARQLDRLAPVADLLARLYIAKVFFSSGLVKIKNWDSTIYMFTSEYHVPFLPPEAAAVMGAAGELALPVLLVVGLFTRFAASGLFVLNIMAVVSYYDTLKDSPAAIQDHWEWGILLALLLVAQAHKLSVDHLFIRRLFPAKSA